MVLDKFMKVLEFSFENSKPLTEFESNSSWKRSCYCPWIYVMNSLKRCWAILNCI